MLLARDRELGQSAVEIGPIGVKRHPGGMARLTGPNPDSLTIGSANRDQDSARRFMTGSCSRRSAHGSAPRPAGLDDRPSPKHVTPHLSPPVEDPDPCQCTEQPAVYTKSRLSESINLKNLDVPHSRRKFSFQSQGDEPQVGRVQMAESVCSSSRWGSGARCSTIRRHVHQTAAGVISPLPDDLAVSRICSDGLAGELPPDGLQGQQHHPAPASGQ